jgi:hypothetical protein
MTTVMSKHATIRASQRGISEAHIRLVLAHADRCVPHGSGTELYSLSKRMLRQFGPQTPEEGEDTHKLKDLRVLVGSDGTIVTCWKGGR